MKTLLLYFSGTGNTHFIAREVTAFLKERSIDIDRYSYEELNKKDISGYDFLIVGSPIYACEVPPFFQNFILSLKMKEKLPVFIYTTMGLYEGKAHIDLAEKLQHHNCIIAGGQSLIMPGSDGLAMMKEESSMLKKMINKDFRNLESLQELKEKIHRAIVSAAEDRKSVFNKKGRRTAANILMGPVYKWGEKYMLKKFRVRSDACTRCNICVKQCPSGNITMVNENIDFDDKCFYCLRCLHQCPAHAIEIANLTVGKFRYRGPMKDFKPGKLFSKIEQSSI